MKLMVTGGAGFIGSNFIRYVLSRDSEIEIINVDKLTYAGNLGSLHDVESRYLERYTFHMGDICDGEFIKQTIVNCNVEAIINFAAESHVDRSILDSDVFVTTNIVGAKALLDAALDTNISLFIQISTDEVYGSLGSEEKFTEDTQIAPNNPYSASKAAADHIARAYYKTYKLPVIITRCSNNYGPYQFPEKFIPLMILNAQEDIPLPIYGRGVNIRDWIHVQDHCAALFAVLKKGKQGEVYNIGGECEQQNIDIAYKILDVLSKPRSLITYVTDRQGHDLRYATDFSKLTTQLGWEPKIGFEEGLVSAISWYVENAPWLENVETKGYLTYYEEQYGSR